MEPATFPDGELGTRYEVDIPLNGFQTPITLNY